MVERAGKAAGFEITVVLGRRASSHFVLGYKIPAGIDAQNVPRSQPRPGGPNADLRQ
jgi:hypothetical protein